MEHGPYDIRALQGGMAEHAGSPPDRAARPGSGGHPHHTYSTGTEGSKPTGSPNRCSTSACTGSSGPTSIRSKKRITPWPPCAIPGSRDARCASPSVPAGDAPNRAVTYWGISQQEYYARADVWPLNPQGELLCCLIPQAPRGSATCPRRWKRCPASASSSPGRATSPEELGHPRQAPRSSRAEGRQGVSWTLQGASCAERLVPHHPRP